jgi:hypothetical protein
LVDDLTFFSINTSAALPLKIRPLLKVVDGGHWIGGYDAKRKEQKRCEFPEGEMRRDVACREQGALMLEGCKMAWLPQ